MKKTVNVLWAIVALFVCGCSSSNDEKPIVKDQFNNEETIDGSSEATAYEIDNAFQLKLLAERVNQKKVNPSNVLYSECYYKLTDDIDLLDVCGKMRGDWIAIGTAGNVMADSVSFNGHFDGNNHTISNLYINDDSSFYCQTGLFGSVINATIQNLHVSGNVSINGFCQKQVDNIHIGSVVALASGSYIKNCSSNVKMNVITKLNPDSLNTTDRNKWRVGGVVGLTWQASKATVIDGCSYSGLMEVINMQPQSGAILTIGGVCGGMSTSNNSEMRNCYNSGTITETNDGGVCHTYVGGILGSTSVDNNNNNLYNCYNTGEVSKMTEGSDSSVGGIVGYIAKGNTVKNVYSSKGEACGNVKGITENCFSSTDAYNTSYIILNEWVTANGTDIYYKWSGALAFLEIQ